MSNASTKVTAETQPFDASALDTIEACNKGAEIEIKTISGNPTGLMISLVGKDSDVYRGRIRAMADDSLRRQATGRTSAADTSLDKLEQKNIDALVAATTGWRTVTVMRDEAGKVIDTKVVPGIALRGELLAFNPDNVRRLYTEILPIREQVSEAINDLGNFIQG